MRRYLAGLTAATVLGSCAALLPGATAAATQARSADGYADISVMSCAAPGDCSAGGDYEGSTYPSGELFVVAENHGTWGTARELPGIGALNVGKGAEFLSMSCASVGNCGAVGFYTDHSQERRAFAVSEKGGKWGKPLEIAGTRTWQVVAPVPIMAVSCPSPGNCAAYGTYATFTSSSSHAFVVSEVRGTWGKARAVPGVKLNALSCGSAGNCVAGGFSATRAVLVTEARGKWGSPAPVPGIAANQTVAPQVSAVSCASAGNCAAGGSYQVGDDIQLFVTSERDGKWETAEELPGIAALNIGGASFSSLSCPSAGNCTGGGTYVDAAGFDAFVADEQGGTWGDAQEVPGTGALNLGSPGFHAAEVTALSCRSAGNCAAGGYYTDSANDTQVFVDTEVSGSWGTAIEVPGTSSLNAGGNASLPVLSCGSAGNCGAGGFYADAALHDQAFVVTLAGGTWGTAIEVPGTAALERG